MRLSRPVQQGPKARSVLQGMKLQALTSQCCCFGAGSSSSGSFCWARLLSTTFWAGKGAMGLVRV